jgi:hypothetical protein
MLKIFWIWYICVTKFLWCTYLIKWCVGSEALAFCWVLLWAASRTGKFEWVHVPRLFSMEWGSNNTAAIAKLLWRGCERQCGSSWGSCHTLGE